MGFWFLVYCRTSSFFSYFSYLILTYIPIYTDSYLLTLTYSHTLIHIHTYLPTLTYIYTHSTAKGWHVRLGVSWGFAAFAWQTWGNVYCQGVECTPSRPVGFRLFYMVGVEQCALLRGLMPRDRIYAGISWLSAFFV